jgi:hypothetical protein
MDTSSITDTEAFRIIRNRSMDKRCSIEDIAHSILTAKDALESALGENSPINTFAKREPKSKVTGSVVRIK